MGLKNNSPVIIIYAFICFVVVLSIITLEGNKTGNQTLGPVSMTFSVGGPFSFTNPYSYFRLFSHIFGHIDFGHFFNNFMLILLVGPILEEKYGAYKLIFMILTTALITGIYQTLFFTSGLMGASGIAFMMIVLISMSNFKSGEIPITFLLVVFLYLGKEILDAVSPQKDQISQSAHIIGGICGGIFGFLSSSKR